MLEAIARRKLRAKDVREDALTSAVFPPLRLFPPDVVWQIVTHALVSRENYPDTLLAFADVTPIRTDIELWPRLQGPGYITEPDALISIDTADAGSIGVLIEVKWDSPLGLDQIRRQRQAIEIDPRLSRYARIINLLIVRRRTQADAERDPSINQSQGEIVITTWSEFAHRLEALAIHDQPQFAPWKNELVSAMKRTEGLPFSHFFIASKLDPADQSCTIWNPTGFTFPVLADPCPIDWRFPT
jgi:hypothetical protein